ncbi:MAG: tetratricopeptide repeat protein [Candidatus Poribacteria bacterium]
MVKLLPFIFLIMLLVINGCAIRSDYYQGQRSLEEGNYDTAISLFQYALRTSPDDPKILTDLGYAYLKKNDYQRAIQYFERAKSIDPTYAKAYLYLGMAYEAQDELPKAIKEYNDYYQQFPMTPMGQKLKARIGILMKNQIAKEVKEAVEKERYLTVDQIPDNTIAVYYFTNHTGNPRLDPLQKGLADILITDLSQVKSLKVLERTRLQTLIDELKLGETGAIDQADTPRFGRLLGARRIITGGFAEPSESILRIDSLATNVATAETDAQANASGKQSDFFSIEKQLAFNIIDNLGISLTQEERDAIQKIPTESFLAFLAYSRGIDYEDKGMYREAANEFKNAVQLDPNFSRANEKLQETQVLSVTPMTGSVSEIAQIEKVTPKEDIKVESKQEIVAGVSAIDRFEPILENIGDGFIPETGSKTEDKRNQTTTTSILTLTIEW